MRPFPFVPVIVSAFLALGASIAPAHAQDASHDGTFDRAAQKLRIGDTIFLTDAMGRQETAKVLDLSPESLTVLVKGARRDVSGNDILAIDIQRNDSLKNGALIGFGIGAGLTAAVVIGLAADHASGGEITSMALAGTLVYGGIGTTVGLLVDACVRERLPVYRAVGKQRAHLGVAPLVGRDKKGIAVTLKWGRG